MIPEKRKVPTRIAVFAPSSWGKPELREAGTISAALATVMKS
jgi:hypothetical protein